MATKEIEYTGPVDAEGNPRHPASDITAPGGVYRDRNGYHDANGNRLSESEGEARIEAATKARVEKLGEPGGPTKFVDQPATREPNPPAKTEDSLEGTEGDPAALEDVQAREEAAREQAEALRAANAESHSKQSEEERRKDAAEASGGAELPPKAGDETKTSSGSRSASSKSNGADYDAMTKGELESEASRRGLTVKRAGGEDGEPLKEDYVRALKKSDKG